MGMAAFMAFILALSIRMMSSQTDDYDHDYYEKGLTFNADYNRERQVTVDHAQPHVSLTANLLDIDFKAMATGHIRFVRPSDRRLDKAIAFKSNADGRYAANIHLPAPGRWQLVVDWQSNTKKYLYQQEVWVP